MFLRSINTNIKEKPDRGEMETRDTGHPFKKFNRSEVNSVAKMFKKM